MEQHLRAGWDDCWRIFGEGLLGGDRLLRYASYAFVIIFFGWAHVCDMQWEVVGKPTGDFEGLFAIGTA